MIVKHPRVLFITSKDDFAIDYLIFKLKSEISYLRLNSEDITNINMTYRNGKIIEIDKNYIYKLNEIEGIYFRRAPNVFGNSVELEDKIFIDSERRNFLEGLYLSLDAKWINPIFSTYKAEKKLYQLTVAEKLGFNIPDTICSNQSNRITEFISSYEECIIKPISHGLQVTKNNIYSIYTSKINFSKWNYNNEIFESPVLIQEKISNYRDIRVTVIGKKIFAVEIDTNEKEKVDWRKPHLDKFYSNHNLPKDIRKLIFKLHDELDLVYSAIDFVLTPSGKYYFLETNPAGEWVWLEKELNINISDAIINELLN